MTSEMFPGQPTHYSEDAGRSDTEPLGEGFVCDAAWNVEGPNFTDGVISQLCNRAPGLALRASLKAGCIGVEHLGAHRRQFKIGQTVIGRHAVEMVDRESGWNGTPKGLPDQAMHLEFLALSPISVAKSHAETTSIAEMEFEGAVLSAPEALESLDLSVIGNCIDTLILENWFPYGQ